MIYDRVKKKNKKNGLAFFELNGWGGKAFLRVPEVLERQTDDAEQPDLLMSELTEVFFCPRAYIPGAPERCA